MLHNVPFADHILSVGKDLFPVLREGLFEDRQETDCFGDMEEGGGGATGLDTVREEGFWGLAVQGEVTVIGDKHTGLRVFSADEDFVTGRFTEFVAIGPDSLIDIDGRRGTFFEGNFLGRHRDGWIRIIHGDVYYIM